jgi:hypothetical protein
MKYPETQFLIPHCLLYIFTEIVLLVTESSWHATLWRLLLGSSDVDLPSGSHGSFWKITLYGHRKSVNIHTREREVTVNGLQRCKDESYP